MNKQIKTCAFDVKIDNGATNASMQGYPKNVEVFSGSFEWQPYYYGGQATDEALSGRLRSRLGGYRIDGQFTWERQVNSTNFLSILNDCVTGVERKFFTLNPDASYAGKANIGITPAPSVSGYFQGMRVDFNGANSRIITNYNASNGQVTLNATVTTTDLETMNIYALSNMTPRVFMNTDASETRQEQVVLTESSWSINLQSTVANQPISVSFRGTNVETSIPDYYKL